MDRGEDKVVVVLDDETRLKGIVQGFDPRQSRFNLREVDITGHQVELHDVDMGAVVVAFFVHDLAVWRSAPLEEEDLPDRSPPASGESGDAIRVTLPWGETLEGIASDLDARRPWFFLVPFEESSRAGNIERVYLTRRAVVRMEAIGED